MKQNKITLKKALKVLPEVGMDLIYHKTKEVRITSPTSYRNYILLITEDSDKQGIIGGKAIALAEIDKCTPRKLDSYGEVDNEDFKDGTPQKLYYWLSFKEIIPIIPVPATARRGIVDIKTVKIGGEIEPITCADEFYCEIEGSYLEGNTWYIPDYREFIQKMILPEYYGFQYGNGRKAHQRYEAQQRKKRLRQARKQK